MVQSEPHHHHLIENYLVFAMIELTNAELVLRQQSLTHSNGQLNVKRREERRWGIYFDHLRFI